ncbi:MAG TPA: FAD:protein FMN transferase, partial [Pirellulales bacterium]
QESSIRFKRAGLQINLGSIGKGYALDRASELFDSADIHDLLIHGGNSSVLARGCNASLGPGQGWLVGVRNPNKPTRYLGQIRLHDRSLSTSGSGTQFFTHEGRRYGHILDPRTGWPAEGVLSVTVIAPTAAQADALSTAFYVLGLAGSQAFCEGHRDVSALMLCAGERQGQLTTHLIGVDPPEWIPASEPE